ncbi:MAG: PAS domain S-box protein [Magnetococcales bacterium]|nr:PAS domain S-box protein [Magnetococcales bacterium]
MAKNGVLPISRSLVAQSVIQVVLVTAAYYVFGRLGLAMPAVGQHITLIWLPTGIAVAALLRWGTPLWPAVYLGAFLVNLHTGLSPLFACGVAVGNTAGPLLTAMWLRHSSFHWEFDHKLDAVWLMVTGMVGMSLSASGGVALLWLNGTLLMADIAPAWFTWWMGDTTGVLLATPLLVALSRNTCQFFHQQRFEVAIILALSFGLNWFIFLSSHHFMLTFLPALIVIWSAMRFGIIGASVTVLVGTVLSALGVGLGNDPFHLGGEYNLLVLWVYMVTHTIISLVVTALQAENRRSTAQAQESYHRLREIAATLAEGLYVIDRQGRITFTNPTALTLLGWQEEEMMGQAAHALFHHSYSDGSPYPPSACSIYEVLNRSSVMTSQDEWFWRRDGSCFPVSVTASPIFKSGVVNGVVVAFRDVTKQKQMERALEASEQQLRDILNNTSSVIFMKDLQGRYLFINHQYEALFRITNEDILGKTDYDIFPSTIAATLQANDRLALSAETPTQIDEIVPQNDGEHIYISVKFPLRDDSGRPYAVCGIATDITERKQMEDALRHAKEQAEQATEAKSNFLAIMSHEIRTPINVVLGILELLEDSDLQQSYREQVQLALNSGKMLLYLINDVLDYSKIEADQLKLESAPFNLRTLLDDIAMNMAPLAHAKNIELTSFFPSKVPVSVCGDANRLRQIFINLINNAIKFTPRGGTVEFHGGPVSREGQWIEFLFEVRDTGIGIPVNDREQIFERFVQANTSTTRQYGGTGLGLTICQRLIQLMNGSIGVDANPFADSGSIFHFTIQLLEQDQLVVPPPQSGLSGTHALIVGSLGLQSAMLHDALETWNVIYNDAYELQSACSMLADAANRGTPYRLVIINQWPGEDKLQGLAQLRAIGRELCFLLLIDRLDQGLDQAAELPGNTLCLRKPFSEDQLHNKICTLLQPRNDHAVQPTIAMPLAHTPQPTYASASILVVDDQEANLTVVLGMLAKVGCSRDRCLTACNGQQAVEQFQQNSFDLIFMDCQMPVMDGYQAVSLIRKWEQQQGRAPIPIIALTADITQMSRQAGEASGMSDFLSKPVFINDLRLMLDRYFSVATTTASLHPEPVEPARSNQLDVIAILQSTGLEEEDLQQVVQLLTDQLPELIRTMERGLREADYEQVRATSHVLHGSVMNVLFPEMKKCTATLHEAVRQRSWGRVQQQLADLQTASIPIQEALTAYLHPGSGKRGEECCEIV